MRLLFVCLGNICRSPTAEGVMAHLLEREGIDGIKLDSAGTGGWHLGAPPDERATAAAAGRGIELEGAARKVTPGDFGEYDLILAMDAENHAELLSIAPGEDERARVRLLREFDPAAVAAGDLDVPDPYFGGDDGFDDVLELVTRACEGLLEEVRAGGT
jgi:protein-tyrosine phosphatase